MRSLPSAHLTRLQRLVNQKSTSLLTAPVVSETLCRRVSGAAEQTTSGPAEMPFQVARRLTTDRWAHFAPGFPAGPVVPRASTSVRYRTHQRRSGIADWGE
jgi:hypothetical protein